MIFNVFMSDTDKFWNIKYASLSRTTNLMILINITIFVASGLVQNYEYYWPLIALVLYSVQIIYTILPFTKLQSTKTYWSLFIVHVLGGYFTISSVVYLIQKGDIQKLFPY